MSSSLTVNCVACNMLSGQSVCGQSESLTVDIVDYSPPVSPLLGHCVTPPCDDIDQSQEVEIYVGESLGLVCKTSGHPKTN